ncbi:hypothetical protein EDD17DRAFT_1767320 [Pisolithus thermaeus]|nr:hypothetical protein EV401DRAFT_2083084 [Pisolithus croceorrhizus]KAI6147565.1 hypothetical protein EDD17DRAFT_1767320 [Pisolithus thermaeus]
MTSSVHVAILSSNPKIYNEYGLSFIAQAPQNILQFDIAMDVTMRVDILKEVPNFSQNEFEVLCHMIDEECLDIPWKLKLTFFVKHNFLMVQLASAIHKAPISEFNSVLSHFQQVSYPHNIVHIQVSMNSDMEEKLISAIPDLSLVISLMKGDKIQCFPLIVECTFSQPHKKVFKKVTMLIDACPEVLMVIIVLINESPCYQSPSEKSLAWKTFMNHQDPLYLTGFMSLCDVNSGNVDVEEDFMVPVVTAGNTWCCISSVDYYIWLKHIPNTSHEGSSSVSMMRVDPDTTVKQSGWSAHGELPGNKNLDHFDRLLNKGLEMIWLDPVLSRDHYVP